MMYKYAKPFLKKYNKINFSDILLLTSSFKGYDIRVVSLWDETDGFYYDHVRNNQCSQPVKIKSMVGLVPLFCSLVLKDRDFKHHPGFAKRTKWFIENRKDLSKGISFMTRGTHQEGSLLLSVINKEKLVKILSHMLDEEKFLSPYGIRSLSKVNSAFKPAFSDRDSAFVNGSCLRWYLSILGLQMPGLISHLHFSMLLIHILKVLVTYCVVRLAVTPTLIQEHQSHPYELHVGGTYYSVQYEPGESKTKLFGGNSNWRGPIWLPMNYLLIENLERLDYFYGDELKVECPTGSGVTMRLGEVAQNLERRLVNLFMPDAKGRRPCHGNDEVYAKDPHFKKLCLFYEYFNGDTGRGCGASHQTGWTSLVANILERNIDVEEGYDSADSLD
ncbi:YM54-like protein [Mya arenaria]|uniref:YM54-like protein n=1 Tax=Mya arenaria TaxID=6604 RepID=A0ABY7E8W5_MYAAR|nr:YM54-like protein [Mya arenaria]